MREGVGVGVCEREGERVRAAAPAAPFPRLLSASGFAFEVYEFGVWGLGSGGWGFRLGV